VIRTRVGYAGGTTKGPTYHNLGDHTETIEIDFDPEKISYGRLLDLFWGAHDPLSRVWSRQYMPAVFFRTEAQKKAAEESKKVLEKEAATRIHTAILPFTTFFLAEGYHQKYYLRRHALLEKELTVIYPALEDFVRSTAVSRVNGYAGGHGTPQKLAADIDMLGLSPKGKEMLSAIVSKMWR